MATATGTASSAVDLLDKLNTFLTANGWTNLRGNTDLACASPKAARYWRLLVLETQNVSQDYREIELLEWRTTSGGANQATNGANYAFSNIASGSGSDLVSGTGTVQSDQIFDQMWWVSYDFGTATTIRELVIQADTANFAPARFYIQWSNDNFSWTTMIYYDWDGTRFTDDSTYTFTWDTGSGYTSPLHASATAPRRGGFSEKTAGDSATRYNEWSDDIWCWQGPGYDAARRVYVSAMPTYDLNSSDEFISFTGSIDVDSNLNAQDWWFNQTGTLGNSTDSNCPTLNLSSNGVSYWFYASGNRFIVVTRSGVDDYTMAYCGFLAAFGQPDDWPYPLYIGASGFDWDYSLTTAGTYIRDAQDPSQGSAYYRRWDNTWMPVYNHEVGVSHTEKWTPDQVATIWPKHLGVVSRWENFPQAPLGDYTNPEGHWLANVDPTEQNDLPVIPAIVSDFTYGFVGALEGVFVVPQGGILAPEGTFTIGADTYRVFTTRDHAEGNQYYCIKEV